MVGTVALATILLTTGGQSSLDKPVQPIEFTTVDDKKVVVPDPKAKATVLVFLYTDCPIANRYAPELKRIETDYTKKGVVFHRVYVYAAATPDEIIAHTKEYGYTSTALHDKAHVLVKAFDARVTPEVVAVLPTGVVEYQGRIDDMYIEHGRLRESGYRRDLRVALDEILAGRRVSLRRTTALGCFIDRG